jgi:hypothetical protein
MTDSQAFAWIFLSVPHGGGELTELIETADAINHAIPLPDELQRSLGWLKTQGFLVKDEGRTYRLTERGAELLARAAGANQTMMGRWDAVSARLDTLVGDEPPLDDPSVEEWNHAYDAYKKRVRGSAR